MPRANNIITMKLHNPSVSITVNHMSNNDLFIPFISLKHILKDKNFAVTQLKKCFPISDVRLCDFINIINNPKQLKKLQSILILTNS